MEYTNKSCENCIWREQCAQEVACKYFEAEEDRELEDVAEYGRDLLMRAQLYQEQVDEQDE